MRQTDLSLEQDKSFLLGLDEIREPKWWLIVSKLRPPQYKLY